jgi:hypothetical protein
MILINIGCILSTIVNFLFIIFIHLINILYIIFNVKEIIQIQYEIISWKNIKDSFRVIFK